MDNMPARRIITKIGDLTDKDLAEIEFLFNNTYKEVSDDNAYLRAILSIMHWLSKTNTLLRPNKILSEKLFEFH